MTCWRLRLNMGNKPTKLMIITVPLEKSSRWPIVHRGTLRDKPHRVPQGFQVPVDPHGPPGDGAGNWDTLAMRPYYPGLYRGGGQGCPRATPLGPGRTVDPSRPLARASATPRTRSSASMSSIATGSAIDQFGRSTVVPG